MNRRFGVEIEMAELGRYETRSQLAADLTLQTGIDVVSESYNHTCRTHWKIITDGSCGYELVSPPLFGEQGLADLKAILERLNFMDVRVNKKCGLHVHIDAENATTREVGMIVAKYAKYEKAIDRMMPISRRESNNRYCRSVMQEFYRSADRYRNNGLTWGHTRYYKLNVASYSRHGTIEFRQHSGTTDYEKIKNWIIFCMQFVNRAVQPNQEFERMRSPISVSNMKSWLFGTVERTEHLKELNGYINKRVAMLNQNLKLSDKL
jgi:hypothetical protein